jgi:Transposase DDE domain group 1
MKRVGALKLDFDRRLVLQFRGSAITSDAGLLPYRELDDALSLTDTGAETLADARTGKNSRHRLAGYEDVNDAERLSRDPAMRWVVGGRAITGCSASASQIRGRTLLRRRPEGGQNRATTSGIRGSRLRGRRAMTGLSRRSVLRSSLALTAAGTLARPYIANAAATTATVWWTQPARTWAARSASRLRSVASTASSRRSRASGGTGRRLSHPGNKWSDGPHIG